MLTSLMYALHYRLGGIGPGPCLAGAGGMSPGPVLDGAGGIGPGPALGTVAGPVLCAV